MKSLHTEELAIALIQMDIVWENKEANLFNYNQTIDTLKQEHPGIDLIILPEMFSTGFTMNPAPVAETMQGATIEWMKEISADYEVALCGSLIIEENGKFYNRFVFVKPDHSFVYYDKKHLFAFAGEDEFFEAGNEQVNLIYKGWSINLFICYDLRFPVWCKNTNLADLMIFVANWPDKRIHHWKALLPARSIENQCFVIGMNRLGTDANDLSYSGQSSIYDPTGNNILNMGSKDGYAVCLLHKNMIAETRDKTPFWKDWDSFVLNGLQEQ